MTEYLYEDIFARSILLWGEAAQQRLHNSHVVLVGLGGVGSYIAEALVRSGIGALTLADNDQVALSNINRQLPALTPELGRDKTEVVGERIAAINPACRLRLLKEFITPQNVSVLGDADCFIDAIDHVPGKVAIITHALVLGKPVASSMGAGRRVAPELLRLADISQTKGCPLARSLRRQLRARGITQGVTVVYSEEAAREPAVPPAVERVGDKAPLGSCAFVPAVAGLLLASAVIRDLAGIER